jgi:hypothetical protein
MADEIKTCWKCKANIVPAQNTPNRWKIPGSWLTSGYDGHKHAPMKPGHIEVDGREMEVQSARPRR